MTSHANAAYCEMMPTFRLGELFHNGRKTGVMHSWFPNSEIHFTYKGRTALRHACDLMGLGDAEVLVPAYNCGAEIEPLTEGGAKVVPYRVDSRASVDMEDLRRLISKETKAIHVTHYFGFPQPIDEVKDLCDQNGLFLIEDCALALFSSWQERKLGSWGDISVFSLSKSLPMPDGGALVINNSRLQSHAWQKRNVPFLKVARRALPLFRSALLRGLSGTDCLNGIYLGLYNRSMAKEFTSSVDRQDPDALPDVPAWMHYTEGFRDRRLPWFSAYMMRAANEDEIIRLRRRNYLYLASLLADNPALTVLYGDLPQGVCPLGLPVICADRDGLYRSLLKRGIVSAVFWCGFHRSMDWGPFPEARFLKNHLLLLPVQQGLGEKDMEHIADSVAAFG